MEDFAYLRIPSSDGLVSRLDLFVIAEYVIRPVLLVNEEATTLPISERSGEAPRLCTR